MDPAWLTLTHGFATIAMTGVIWFVQVVHYPLFAAVGTERFVAFEASHVRRTTWVVAPLMLAELVTAAALAVAPATRGLVPWSGIALLAIAWLSTAFLQVPLHRRLERGFDSDTARRLVATNWIRTVAWTARAAVALALLGCTGSP
ncbi:MAG: hypothetical protein NXI31_06355 [bacterium]|nr:hypothetical protein [bacterium]